MMGMVGASKRSQNVIFKKTDEITVTRSKWLITLVKPSNVLVDELGEQVTKFVCVRAQEGGDGYLPERGGTIADKM